MTSRFRFSVLVGVMFRFPLRLSLLGGVALVVCWCFVLVFACVCPEFLCCSVLGFLIVFILWVFAGLCFSGFFWRFGWFFLFAFHGFLCFSFVRLLVGLVWSHLFCCALFFFRIRGWLFCWFVGLLFPALVVFFWCFCAWCNFFGLLLVFSCLFPLGLLVLFPSLVVLCVFVGVLVAPLVLGASGLAFSVFFVALVFFFVLSFMSVYVVVKCCCGLAWLGGALVRGGAGGVFSGRGWLGVLAWGLVAGCFLVCLRGVLSVSFGGGAFMSCLC